MDLMLNSLVKNAKKRSKEAKKPMSLRVSVKSAKLLEEIMKGTGVDNRNEMFEIMVDDYYKMYKKARTADRVDSGNEAGHAAEGVVT